MPKAVLIGLDGATFTILDPLMERGVMPFLRHFAQRGVRAKLRSVIPALTPPAWTSLMTGKRPGQHGVFDFFQRDSVDSDFVRLADSRDIGSATIWSLASDHGKRVIALNFPVTFPAPAVDGCIVPGGWMPWRQLRLGCHPPGLFDRLRALPSFSPRELALDMALEEKAIEGCASEEYADWVSLHTRREQRWLDILRYLMQTEPADLIGIMFDGVDKLHHLCWRFIDPAFQVARPSAWEQQISQLCERYFRQLDAAIAEIVDLAGPGATVVLASDHGGGPASDVFFVNAWLEQQGFLAWVADTAPTRKSGGSADQSPRLGMGQIARHVYELDWERTVAYAATPSSLGIHIVDRSLGGANGAGSESYRQIQRRLIDGLRALRHPVTGRPVVEAVHTRDEVFAGPFESLAPDLTLSLADGGAVSILRSDTLLSRRREVAGNHRPEGIFLASGPGIRRGASLPDLSIVDVAPLLLYSAEVPVPDDMTGRFPDEVFEPAALHERPVRTATGQGTLPRDGAGVPEPHLEADDEAAVMARLRALGYVD